MLKTGQKIRGQGSLGEICRCKIISVGQWGFLTDVIIKRCLFTCLMLSDILGVFPIVSKDHLSVGAGCL